MPDYGYLHLARVLGRNQETGGYTLQGLSLASTSQWPSVPSCVPDLRPDDRVILGATGTTRDNLVILAKVGAELPGIGDIDGLLAALADKARRTELETTNGVVAALAASVGDIDIPALQAQIDALETTVATGDATLQGQIDATDVTVDSLVTGVDDLGTAVNAIAGGAQFSYGNDVDIANDLISTIPRWAATSNPTLGSGQAVYTRLITRRRMSLSVIKLAFLTTAVPTTGVFTISVWAGANTAALPRIATTTLSFVGGRQDYVFTPTIIDPGMNIVVGMLCTGLGSGQTLKPMSTPPSNVGTLLNQDDSLMTSMTKGGLISMPTGNLKFNATSDFDSALSYIPWIALGGSAA